MNGRHRPCSCWLTMAAQRLSCCRKPTMVATMTSVLHARSPSLTSSLQLVNSPKGKIHGKVHNVDTDTQDRATLPHLLHHCSQICWGKPAWRRRRRRRQPVVGNVSRGMRHLSPGREVSIPDANGSWERNKKKKRCVTSVATRVNPTDWNPVG